MRKYFSFDFNPSNASLWLFFYRLWTLPFVPFLSFPGQFIESPQKGRSGIDAAGSFSSVAVLPNFSSYLLFLTWEFFGCLDG